MEKKLEEGPRERKVLPESMVCSDMRNFLD